MKIVVDMNLSPQWIPLLNKVGHTAIHWSAIGLSNATDREIMAWAKDNSHVALTHDLDFGAILAATNASAPSVVQLRMQDIAPEGLAASLVILSLANYERDLGAGALILIDKNRARLRLLPLFPR